jgi:metal-responsive CopG/Arc/MetJ family transcriptional regulator
MYTGVGVMYMTARAAPRMRRTQIYLPPDLSDALDSLARKRGTSRAEVIREAAERLVQEEAPPERDPILDIIGMVQGGEEEGDVARQHDRYLVEDEIARWRQ